MAKQKKTKPTKDLEAQFDSAKLKLAILKENFQYRAFFKTLYEDLEGLCPELAKPGEDLVIWHHRCQQLERDGIPFFGNAAELFGLNSYFLIEALNDGLSLPQVLQILDPRTDVSDLSEDKMQKVIPKLFTIKSVEKLNLVGKLAAWDFYDKSLAGHRRMRPYERLVKIDLRQRKAKILKEFEKLIDSELKIQEKLMAESRSQQSIQSIENLRHGIIERARHAIESKEEELVVNYRSRESSESFVRLLSSIKYCPGSYGLFVNDTSRERKRVWEQLEVWYLRKQGKPLIAISRQLGIKEYDARQRFYDAYELTQGKPYDKEKFKKNAQRHEKSDWLNFCEKCKDKECLKQLRSGKLPDNWVGCPKILPYLEQDQIALQEKLS